MNRLANGHVTQLPILTRLVAANPDLFTEEELARGTELQARIDHLRGQLERYAGISLMAASRAALEAYSADPSDENLDRAEEALRRSFSFSPTAAVPLRIKPLIKAAVEDCMKGPVRDWFRPIWQRMRDAAQKRLEETTETENARIRELTGLNITGSQVIDATQAVVDAIDNLGYECCFCGELTRPEDRSAPPDAREKNRVAREPTLRTPVQLLHLFGKSINLPSGEPEPIEEEKEEPAPEPPKMVLPEDVLLDEFGNPRMTATGKLLTLSSREAFAPLPGQ